MKKVSTLLLLFVVLVSCGQSAADLEKMQQELAEKDQKMEMPKVAKGFKEHSTDVFWMNYPEEWELQATEEDGLKFSIFSPLDGANDMFRENMNMTTEALPNSSITLSYYVESAMEMITTSIPGVKVLENKTVNGKYGDYQKVVYSGDYGGMNLKWKQFVQIKGATAYVVSFTALSDTYDEFDAITEKTMTSFILKD